MFIVNFIFSIAKIIIVTVGTIFCCAFVRGKKAPFERAIKRIEKRDRKNTCTYCHH